MINLFEDIPYCHENVGKRFLVDRKDLRLVQIALMPGQAIPKHMTDGNVNILILKGSLDITAGEEIFRTSEGSLVSIVADTFMQAVNNSNCDATFMIIKTPKPGSVL